MVSRGKPSQAVAGLRPLHGFTYRFRNARRSRPYNADEQLYEMLSHAPTKPATWRSASLKDFFFAGVDARTEAPRLGRDIDVETQALISLSEAVQGADHRPAPHRPRQRSYPPLYQEAADLLADDVLRLLVHRDAHPAHGARRVPEDPLRVPPRAVPPEDHEAAARHGPRRASTRSAGRRVLPRRHRTCRTTRPGTARRAERRRVVRPDPRFRPGHVHGEEAGRLRRAPGQAQASCRGPPGGFFQVSDLLALLGPRYRKERTAYAAGRLTAIEAARDPGEDDDPAVTQLLQLGTGRVHHLRRGDHALPGQVPSPVPDRVPGLAAAKEPARGDDRPAQGRRAPLHARQPAA